MEYLTEKHRIDTANRVKDFVAKNSMDVFERLIGLKEITINNYITQPLKMSVKFMHAANHALGVDVNGNPLTNGSYEQKEEAQGQEKEALPVVNVAGILDAVSQDTPVAAPSIEVVSEPTEPVATPLLDLGAQPDPSIKPIQGRDICVVEPFYREVSPKTHISMKSWYDPATMRTIWKDQESFLVRTRNRLAASFLKTGCQWSIWIDNDIITPCKPEMYRFLVDSKTASRVKDEFLATPLPQRLMKWGKTIVSATYFDRHGHGSIMAVLRSKPNGKLPLNQLAPAVFTGMGLVLIHRQVFFDILAKFPELAATKDEKGTEREPGFFTPYQRPLVNGKGGGTAGEDEAFFKRAADAGHPAYVDLGCIAGHIGTCCYGMPDNL